MPARSDVDGFTLIEILITVAIIALGASLVVSNLSSLVGVNKIDQCGYDVRAVVQEAVINAVSAHEELILVYDLSGQEVRIERPRVGQGDEPDQDYGEREILEEIDPYELPSDMRLHSVEQSEGKTKRSHRAVIKVDDNGNVEPHRVWVKTDFKDGSPQTWLSVSVSHLLGRCQIQWGQAPGDLPEVEGAIEYERFHR